MGLARCAWVVVATAALLTACSLSTEGGAGSGAGSPEDTAGSAPTDTATDGVVNVATLHLEGKVDRIVTMLPPGASIQPPNAMFQQP